MVRWQIFRDRPAAGAALAARFPAPASDADEPIVLALPRGGVPVARELALRLDAPLDVLVVRKVGAPLQPELAIGAVAPHDVVLREPHADLYLRADDGEFEALATRERAELARRERLYRAGRRPLDLQGRRVIIVDDGIATGATMHAAVLAARAAGAARVTVAAPVASAEAAERLARVADSTVFLATPEHFNAVGAWYEIFDQTSDAEVCEILSATARAAPPSAARSSAT